MALRHRFVPSCRGFGPRRPLGSRCFRRRSHARARRVDRTFCPLPPAPVGRRDAARVRHRLRERSGAALPVPRELRSSDVLAAVARVRREIVITMYALDDGTKIPPGGPSPTKASALVPADTGSWRPPESECARGARAPVGPTDTDERAEWNGFCMRTARVHRVLDAFVAGTATGSRPRCSSMPGALIEEEAS